MTCGKRIRQAREEQRFTQEQLAERLDVSRQAVSKWEADLSRPTREKLDRLSEILNIPPEEWTRLNAEAAAAARPTDAARPWKIATAVLAAVCAVLAAALAVSLRSAPEEEPDGPPPVSQDFPAEPAGPVEPGPDGAPDAPADPVFPDTLPVTFRRDFDFGDWPLGEYDPAEVPFLEDGEKVMENELWCGWFPDGTRLSLVKARAAWDQTAARFHIYLLWAPPVETAGGEMDCRILYRIGEDYAGDDCGDPEAAAFTNVLGHDGFRITLSHADSFYRDSAYIIQRPDGTPAIMTMSGETGREADVDDDGVLEIVSFNRYLPGWEIIDTAGGAEGSFVYTLDYAGLNLPGGVSLDFDPERGGFVVVDGDNAAVCRYALQDGRIVRLPLTDFSALDYPDAAATKITFITDLETLSDGLDPDEILPYTASVRITHRQQACLALQELYNITGLKVEACYCTANEYGVLFSLLPDGFNQRSFFSLDFNARYGNMDNIPSLHIVWQELDSDWSPLSLADAVRPDHGVTEAGAAMLWYYDRMKIFNAGAASRVSGGDPSCAGQGEIWLENGDLYNCFLEETEYGPVLTAVTGPYPDGVLNH